MTNQVLLKKKSVVLSFCGVVIELLFLFCFFLFGGFAVIPELFLRVGKA